MTLSSFLAGFIGAFTGLAVYQLIIRPLFLHILRRIQLWITTKRKQKHDREFQEGIEFAWAKWGTSQLTYNAINGMFGFNTPFSDGIRTALKEIWPLEKDRRDLEEIERRTR